MRRLVLGLPLLLASLPVTSSPAWAQPRPFNCIGAERLREDVAVVTFARGADRVAPEAVAVMQPLAVLAREAPARNFCVLGFASSNEGGAQSGSRLAARRARAVGLELAKMGIERDRVRAEARIRGFASTGVDRRAGARIVLLPVQ
ncbi:MAG: hypothetical protein JWR10_2476 [Rubritepida sp.]|nr:hypothetical protein [Rubritepida sp.]